MVVDNDLSFRIVGVTERALVASGLYLTGGLAEAPLASRFSLQWRYGQTVKH